MFRHGRRLLETGFTAPQLSLLRAIGREAGTHGARAYLVGGAPRDLVLGEPVVDLDVVVEGDAIAVARGLARQRGGEVVRHPRFGTATWTFGSGGARRGNRASHLGNLDHIDFITARSEAYPQPGGLPVTRSDTLDQDLARRDFTVNTLAIELHPNDFGKIQDDFGALGDLQAGKIRVLHAASFRDDPTRMYRAVRYARRYGFSLATPTARLMKEGRAFVQHVSGHRLKRELDLILGETAAVDILRDLARHGLLRAIDPSLPANRSSLGRLRPTAPRQRICGPQSDHLDMQWILWLMGLEKDQITAVGKRLPFGRRLLEAILGAATLSRGLRAVVRMGPAEATAYLSDLPFAAVQAVCLSTTSERSGTKVARYISEWRHVRLRTRGADLRRRGIEPGPAYGQILDRLLAARLDGEIRDANGEVAWLDAHLGTADALHAIAATNPSMRRRRRKAR